MEHVGRPFVFDSSIGSQEILYESRSARLFDYCIVVRVSKLQNGPSHLRLETMEDSYTVLHFWASGTDFYCVQTWHSTHPGTVDVRDYSVNLEKRPALGT